MKKFPGIIVLLIVAFIMSCKDDQEDTWTQYQNWRNENAAYFNQKRAETDPKRNGPASGDDRAALPIHGGRRGKRAVPDATFSGGLLCSLYGLPLGPFR